MDENKMIRPMDFVRLTNIDELNVIKDTKNHIGLVKERGLGMWPDVRDGKTVRRKKRL